MGAVLKSLLNRGFNFAILRSDGNIEYFIDKLKIREMGLVKTVAPSFNSLLGRLSRAAASRGNKTKVRRGD